jgi:hypothetical protein
MTESPTDADEFAYDTTDVVLRNDDECYELVVWPVNGRAVTTTKAFTYNRTHGLYWLSKTDTPDLFARFETVFDGLLRKYRAIDEVEFNMEPDESFEVLVTIVPESEGRPYDASIDAREAEVCATMRNDSWGVDALDELFYDFSEYVASPEVDAAP